MDLGIQGKVAFVAGSSMGLGRAVAMELGKAGCHLIICSRNEKRINEAGQLIEQETGTSVLALTGDLSHAEDREKVIEATLKKFGRVDILVTNTGGPPAGKFEDFEKKDWDNAYELLLGSAVGMIKGFLPAMKENKWGRIIAITSQAVRQPVDNLILSNSVRASVVGLTKTLAGELGPYHITVNNVMPGYMDTERLRSLMAGNDSFGKDLKAVPLGRIGRPEEFAAAVAFLASARASYITGVSLAVDGGRIKSVL